MERFLHGVAQRYGTFTASPGSAHPAALKQLWALAYREASTLAIADAFLAIGLAFAVATLLVPLMRKVEAAPPASASQH